MRPYVEVIVDSFRAAMATRVLYVMLALITLFLLVIAPLGLKEDIAWNIDRQENSINEELVTKRLVEGSTDEEKADIQRIWNKLSNADQLEIKQYYDQKNLGDPNAEADEAPESNSNQSNPRFQQIRLTQALNKVIEDVELYQPDTWNERSLSGEARELIDDGLANISDKRKKRLNRLLIEQSLGRDAVYAGQETSIQFRYLFWNLDFLPGLSKSLVHSFIADWLPFIFDKFVMSIGLLIAILLTASIVPDTFEPGSLNLLLSKPITRWGLLLAKFIGGCAFIFLCAVYLFFGVWLILGIQWDFWNRAILYSIPLYLLVFAIYYSISMLVGIWKRSPVLSVICTLLFWATCYAIGVAHNSFSDRLRVSQITDVRNIDDKFVGIDRFGFVNVWDKTNNKWSVGIEGDDEQMQVIIASVYGASFFDWMLPGDVGTDLPAYAPIYDAQSNSFMVPQMNFTDPSSAGTPQLVQTEGTSSQLTAIGPARDGTVRLLPDDQRGPIVVTRSGAFYRLDIEAAKAALKAKNNKSSVTPTSNNLSQDAPPSAEETDPASDAAQPEDQVADASQKTDRKPYVRIGPNKAEFLRDPNHVAINSQNGEIAMFGRKRIRIYKLGDDDKYTFDREGEIDPPIENDMTAWITYFGNKVVVGLGSGSLLVYDSQSLEQTREIQSETKSAISTLAGSPDGKWLAVVNRNGTCWRADLDSDGSKLKKIGVGKKVSHVGFSADNSMLVAHDINFLTRYDEELNATEAVKPKLGFVGKAYYYVLRPLYVVCPKPGEFYKLVTHLTSEDSKGTEANLDRTKLPEPTNPWAPLLSGLVFMVTILLFTCFVFQRTDY